MNTLPPSPSPQFIANNQCTQYLTTYPLPVSCVRPDEVQIVVAHSELAIERGDFEKALKILGNVPPESPAYVRVQVTNCSSRFIARFGTVDGSLADS